MPFFVVNLALPTPLRRLFDYLPVANEPRESYLPGLRVKVRFGSQSLIGVVISTCEHSEVPADKLRAIEQRLESKPLLSSADLQLCQWLANYYHHSLGAVLEHFLPTLLRQGYAPDSAYEEVWTRQAQPTEVEIKGSKRQALWQLFQQQPIWAHRQLTQQGFALTQLRALAEMGLIQASKRLPLPAIPLQQQAAFQLNAEQQQAVEQVSAHFGRFNASLLEGVTGSGKTEVYLQLIQRCLDQGKQALVLVPEIGLTPQTVQRFQARFTVPVALLHSGLNDRERLQGWLQSQSGQARILIGTRSAVFTPLPDLGLIIIDEEHDSSFKQQDGLRYSARDFALVKAHKAQVPILLGSATPSLESLHNALTGKYLHLRLTQRAGNAQMPKMTLQSIVHQPLLEGFSEHTLQHMQAHLKRGQQVLVFLNRRGFAPLVACQDCGHKMQCPHCDASLTLHQNPQRLLCHHCEFQQAVPNSCPSCQGPRMYDIGLGTEKVADYLTDMFPDTTLYRVDRDNVRSKQAFDQLYQQLQKGEPCLLIGTQMLAKGHHFPAVTLVVILDMDNGLFSSDFRGMEHSAQLIYQVAGRAGRAEMPGEVIIQTLYANHPQLNLLIEQGYHALAHTLLEQRQQLRLPPFNHLALVRAEAEHPQQAIELLNQVRGLTQHWLQHNFSQQPQAPLFTLGPIPAIMERKAGRFRYQLQIHAEQRPALHALLSNISAFLEQHKLTKRVRCHLDIDPIDTL